MKPRHAAAFALVGWYLITPPWMYRSEDLSRPVAQRHYEPNPDAPYSHWRIQEGFDSAEKCASVRKSWSGAVSAENNWFYAVCIASDDPRLKGKQDQYEAIGPLSTKPRE